MPPKHIALTSIEYSLTHSLIVVVTLAVVYFAKACLRDVQALEDMESDGNKMA